MSPPPARCHNIAFLIKSSECSVDVVTSWYLCVELWL